MQGFDLTWRRILVGAECAIFSMLFTYPYDLLRVRMHVDLLKTGLTKKHLQAPNMLTAGSNVKFQEGGNLMDNKRLL